MQGFVYYLVFLAIIPIVIFMVWLWFYEKNDEEREYIKVKLYDCVRNGKISVARCSRHVADNPRNCKKSASSSSVTIAPQVTVQKEQTHTTRALTARKMSLTLPSLQSAIEQSAANNQTGGGFNVLSNESTPSTPQSSATTISPVETPKSAGSAGIPVFPSGRFSAVPRNNHLPVPCVHYSRPAPPPPPVRTQTVNENRQ